MTTASVVASGDTGIIAKGAKATIDPAGDIVVDQIVITKTSGNANKVGLADIDIFLPPVDTGFVYNVPGDGRRRRPSRVELHRLHRCRRRGHRHLDRVPAWFECVI